MLESMGLMGVCALVDPAKLSQLSFAHVNVERNSLRARELNRCFYEFLLQDGKLLVENAENSLKNPSFVLPLCSFYPYV